MILSCYVNQSALSESYAPSVLSFPACGWAPPAHDGRGRPRSPDIAVCFSDNIRIKPPDSIRLESTVLVGVIKLLLKEV